MIFKVYPNFDPAYKVRGGWVGRMRGVGEWDKRSKRLLSKIQKQK